MKFSIFLCIATSVFVFFLGIYVLKIQDRKKIQKAFAALCTLISIWLLAFSVRHYVKIEYRQIALDWMLIPPILFPILLDRIISLIADDNHKISKFQLSLNTILSIYFITTALTCSFSKIEDVETFSYSSTIHYHLFMAFIFTYGAISISKIMYLLKRDSGNQRARISLMLGGIINLLLFTAILLYILPIFGIFLGYFVSIGVLISVILWSIAILQFDAFQIKYSVIEGKKVPLLSQFSLSLFLTIFKLVDPSGYRISNFQYKLRFTSSVLYSDLTLRSKTELGLHQRAEILARRYDPFIK
ncbi:hypothetical protein EHQ76_07145 [Leptospira barantonii]|uniref:Histidine kinase N-terminal 7TM region domain-containing protein n=1 Tax=Leptospira barantonii TaxID=2023184 RepID=A0A5F2BGW7_9LEPT|nr:histidine kinase N-terminal 7TM domain-containing protein [Leptospira barantonii]TGM04816.1 hypothetical protein EHQ76_07145 [Leptospira barantonii]